MAEQTCRASGEQLDLSHLLAKAAVVSRGHPRASCLGLRAACDLARLGAPRLWTSPGESPGAHKGPAGSSPRSQEMFLLIFHYFGVPSRTSF